MSLSREQMKHIQKSNESVEYLAWQYGVSEDRIREIQKPKAPVEQKEKQKK